MILIFDLDGLLVDTERLFFQAVVEIAETNKSLPVPTYEEYVEVVVSGSNSISTLVGLSGSVGEEFGLKVSSRYSELLKEGVQLKDGAIQCLEGLSEYHLDLVTGSKREHAEYILKTTGLEKYFTHVLTRDENFLPKPHAGLFEHVIEKHNVNPWDCIVIEDSYRGVSAAVALGMPAVVVGREHLLDNNLGPQVVVIESLRQLAPDFVRSVFNKTKPKIDFTLSRLYGDSISRVEDILATYRDIYGLEEFLHIDSDVPPEAFEYAKKRRYFVILAMITRDGRIYFRRSFDSGHLTLMLPGAGLHIEQHEGIHDAINRMAGQLLGEARLADIAPVAYLKNEFHCSDGRVVDHVGLGVRAVLLNDERELARRMDDINVKGQFVSNYDPTKIEQPPSRFTYEKVLSWKEAKNYETYVNEIESQKRVIGRYRFHQSFINPIFKRVSRWLGQNSIFAVKAKVIDSIKGANKFIDVACGDDKSIFKVVRHVRLVVANDIAVDQLAELEGEYRKHKVDLPKSNAVVFTNHDCMDLPFRDNSFDVALCRNLLHHMQTAGDLRSLLRNARRIARKVVVVEIEDPATEGLWGKMRNSYYMDFLDDQGHSFYNRRDFEIVVRDNFQADDIEFSYMPTIRGTYMMAIVNRRNAPNKTNQPTATVASAPSASADG